MKDALKLHRELNGKLRITSKIPLRSKKILSLAYTPGVAEAAKQIVLRRRSVYDLTIKKNTVAVVTDGSSVLGLGNIGPEAALPVMEGKCAILSQFAGLNAFPICLNTQDESEIIQTVKIIAPVFGAIILEDISAPRCFRIENELQGIGIPVIHDDQHATSIAVLSALINALKIAGKHMEEVKIVVIGSGAAGIAITKLLLKAGFKRILVVDSRGIVSTSRKDVAGIKIEIGRLTNPKQISGKLQDAVIDSDVLIGVSAKAKITGKMIRSMSSNPIIFALSNPIPEIFPLEALKYGVKIMATGRSDFPNQVNNALIFPGLTKGLIESGKNFTESIKLDIAYAMAALIKNPTPRKFVPSLFDKLLIPTIVRAVKLS